MNGYKIFAFLLPLCAFGQTKYMIQDLGTLSNMPSCTATAISQSGQVTGYCNPAGGSIITGAATRGFLYSKGTLMDLGPSPKQSLVPTGVNDSGVVVGA